MTAPFIRTPYNYDTDKASLESGLTCKDKTLTQQHFKDECDINVIVERFGLTGEMPQVLNMPTYGDFTGIFDFQSAMNTITQANEQFMLLPAKLRARFNNNPDELIHFLADETNRPEAENLGLVNSAQPHPQTPPPPAPPPEK